ncbi:MAG: hypothetical protein C5B59_14910 [Bacteroidetes bacterium]|nr:MAG: hypothetical protein C5B59_14910 [Bacteroidota bacterium]
MHELEHQLRRVNEKLQLLIKQYHILQKENERLRQEKDQESSRCQDLTLESEKWQQQAQLLKMTKEEMDEGEKKAFEKRLSQYVKEIDRCIAILNE